MNDQANIWTPRPERMVAVRGQGLQNMGDVTDRGAGARFFLRDVEFEGAVRQVTVWTLIAIRGRFVGGTGSATLSLRVDHRIESGLFDWTLKTWANMGATNRNLLHRASDDADLWATYPFFHGDELVCEWTNPAAGTMRWVLEFILQWAELAPKG